MLDGRLMFQRRYNGLAIRATGVIPGKTDDRNAELTTCAEHPPASSGMPTSPSPISSVDHPAVHPTDSGVSVSGIYGDAGAKNYHGVSGRTRVTSDSISSVNDSLSATVLTPGNALMKGSRYNRVCLHLTYGRWA